MRDNGGTQMVATDLNLAPLSNGDYLIEVTAKVGRQEPTRKSWRSGCRWRGEGRQVTSTRSFQQLVGAVSQKLIEPLTR